MPKVGIRELKYEVSEVMRAVREERAEYVVTYHGRPVAVILPVDSEVPAVDVGSLATSDRAATAVEAELDALRAEIDAKWQSERSAVELLLDQRR